MSLPATMAQAQSDWMEKKNQFSGPSIKSELDLGLDFGQIYLSL